MARTTRTLAEISQVALLADSLQQFIRGGGGYRPPAVKNPDTMLILEWSGATVHIVMMAWADPSGKPILVQRELSGEEHPGEAPVPHAGFGRHGLQRVLITGASGPIGSALLASFTAQNTQVVRLVRGQASSAAQISWDPLTALSPAAVSGFDAVIHLAGESVVGRWTDAKKKAIRESRVLGTRNLAAALARSEAKPRVLVCASAVGFYGNRGEEVLREESPIGRGFLPEVCGEWEDASRIAAEAGIRTVNIRIGLVLTPKGGALGKMLTPFTLGLGGRMGLGRQWMSWIHVDDIVGAIHHAIGAESLAGPVNLVAPNPVRNAEFTKVLASVLRRPAFFPVPAFALRLAFGKQAAEEMLLASQRVQPGKLGASGYTFRFRELRAALQNLVG
jgi:hypothetical protein